MYNSSRGEDKVVITCSAPNMKADVKINNHLFGNAFLKLFLNTNSSVQGAINPALININPGKVEIISCTACSLAACPSLNTKEMMMLDIIIMPNPTNQYFIAKSMLFKKLSLNFFHSSFKSFWKIKIKTISKIALENVESIICCLSVILVMFKFNKRIGINWK